jgi:hypothetical protein
MNVPGELIIPLSQFWHLEAMQILLFDQIRRIDPLHSFFSSLHTTVGLDLSLIPYEISGFHISGVFTPLDFKYLDA